MNPIDVKKEVEKKNKSLLRIPFLISWLKKIVHEKEINDFLSIYGELQGASFAREVLKFFNVYAHVITKVSLPKDGRYIFVANHPLGGLDGIALITTITDMFHDVKFPVNDILLSIKNFDSIFIPINKHGAQSRDAVKKTNEAYASNLPIAMFPAGLVSRKIDGKIVDLQWQKHFVKKAIESKRTIVPVYIEAKNSNRFYRIANWRKWLGIKSNIEMLFLSDEIFRQKNKTFKIVFGTPIPYEQLQNGSLQDQADCIRKKVYALA
ncbi:MAG: 1-acyl-sn-glycerol-3-phosphate acyltransferase [Candidatus Absconditabacterales bacterium]